MKRLRRLLFGRDLDECFDWVEYRKRRMWELPLWWRFSYRLRSATSWKLWYWMNNKDREFSVRYHDLRKAANPERYIQ